jgi:hypothetical protein
MVQRRCEESRLALQQAATVVDAKRLLDQSELLEHAVAKRGLGRESVVAVSTLRVRAERRVGELLQQQAKHRGGRPRREDTPDRVPATLRALGLTRDASSHYQRLSGVPEPTFEQVLDELAGATRGGRITRRAVLRQVDTHAQRTREEGSRDVDQFVRSCERIHAQATPVLEAIRLGHVPAPLPTGADAAVLRPVLLPLRQAREAIAEVEAALLAVVKTTGRG